MLPLGRLAPQPRKLRFPDGEEAGPFDRCLHRGCGRGSLVEVSRIAQRQERRRKQRTDSPTLSTSSVHPSPGRYRARSCSEHLEASRSVHPVERVGGDQDRPPDRHHRVRLPQAEEERAPSRLHHDRACSSQGSGIDAPPRHGSVADADGATNSETGASLPLMTRVRDGHPVGVGDMEDVFTTSAAMRPMTFACPTTPSPFRLALRPSLEHRRAVTPGACFRHDRPLRRLPIRTTLVIDVPLGESPGIRRQDPPSWHHGPSVGRRVEGASHLWSGLRYGMTCGRQARPRGG